MRTYATVDDWFLGRERWHDECSALRRIVLAAGLTETMKWRQPAYTDRGRNVCLVSCMKDAAIVSFLQGGLLDDPAGRLVAPGEHARIAKFMRFTSLEQIEADRAVLEGFLAEAVANERAGRKVPPLPDEIDYVDELRERLDADPGFRGAFEALTPGRRRAYNIHFGGAKESATRVARIEKATDRIFAGKGPNDCICGHSKRKPRCDGSHKHLSSWQA